MDYSGKEQAINGQSRWGGGHSVGLHLPPSQKHLLVGGIGHSNDPIPGNEAVQLSSFNLFTFEIFVE